MSRFIPWSSLPTGNIRASLGIGWALLRPVLKKALWFIFEGRLWGILKLLTINEVVNETLRRLTGLKAPSAALAGFNALFNLFDSVE